MMSIREKINYLTAIESTINYINEQIRWTMNIVYNEETGEPVQDASGNYVYAEPEEGTTSYESYMGYKMLKESVRKLADKL